jgi:hypothetical protein
MMTLRRLFESGEMVGIVRILGTRCSNGRRASHGPRVAVRSGGPANPVRTGTQTAPRIFAFPSTNRAWLSQRSRTQLSLVI